MIVVAQGQARARQNRGRILQRVGQSIDFRRRTQVYSSGESIHAELCFKGLEFLDNGLWLLEQCLAWDVRGSNRQTGVPANSRDFLVTNRTRRNQFHRRITDLLQALHTPGKRSRIRKIVSYRINLSSNL